MAKIDYKKIAFVLIKPPSRVIGYHLIKSAAEHQTLIEKAITSGHCLYSAPITKSNGKYIATQPWQLDENTLPITKAVVEEIVEEPVQPEPDGLYCPFCDKPMSSTPGRTLHVKSIHPEQLEEYHKWLKSLGKKSSKKQ